jgi:hypothetical protein
VAGNTNTVSTSTDNIITLETVKPDVTINQAGGQSDPTNASPVLFTAVFDEPINDATFTDADVTIGGTATTGAVTVTEIAPNDDTTFSVSVVMTGDGTVTADIGADVAEDLAGNTNTVSTSTDNTVTYDGNKPNVTIDQAGAQADPTNASPVVFTAVFDEPINDATFTSVDVVVGGTATTGAITVTEIAPNDDTTFLVSIVVTADGTVTPTIAVGDVEDLVGNTNNASTSTDNTVTVDTVAATNPTLICTSHTAGVWSADNDFFCEGFETAYDALSGVAGFYVEWVIGAGTPMDGILLEVGVSAASIHGFLDGLWYFDCETVDEAGNWSTALRLGPYKIDTTGPVISGNPGDQAVMVDHGASSTAVTWVEPTAVDEGCGLATLVTTHSSGDSFRLGTTTVTYTATDLLGNVTTAMFDVVVVEDEPALVIEPAGESGTFLDRCLDLAEGEEPPMAGLCPLAAVYEIGDLVTGACSIMNPGGQPARGSYVHVFVYSVDIEVRPEGVILLDHWVVRYDRDAGGYAFSWDTTDIAPGYYDVYLSFADGSGHTCRIQITGPDE